MNLFTVGPVNMFERTLKVAANQVPYFRNDAFSKVVLDINAITKELVNAPFDAEVILLTTSGTGAMEASVANLCGKNNRALVINGGTFGERFVKLCKVYGVDFEELIVPFDKDLDAEMLSPYMNKNIDTIFVNICETSVGKLYNKQLLGDFAKRIGAVLVVDAVSSFLADEMDMARMGADVVFTGSQKALALDAGLSLYVATQKALNRMKEVKFGGMYLNILDYIADSHRGQTPFTPAVGTIMTLHDRMLGIMENGKAEGEITRCKGFANYFRSNIYNFPFKLPQFTLSNCCTPILCVNNDAQKIKNFLVDNFDIHITPSGGANADKLFRIGHLGNHTIEGIDSLIKGIKEYYK